ncbi:MAG: serine hydrolase [Pseudomonadota bacterium]
MLRGAVFALAALCASVAPAAAQLVALSQQPAGVAWPTQDWSEAPLGADVDRAALDAAMNYAFARVQDDLGETRAIVIIHHGRLVYERYGENYTRDTRLISWSMAKSFTHAFVGAAVLQGRVNIDTPLGSPHWAASDPRAAITWRTFLNMVDGQEWHEQGVSAPTENDSARMLFGEGRRDTAAFAANRPLGHTPGAHWNYNSGGSVLISDALTRIIVPDPKSPEDRRERMRAWMDRSLFNIIGMHPIVQFDPTGLYYGSSQIYATGRDFARFGLLYLRDGMWNGVRVLPEGWVDFARAHGPAADTDIYGAQFWLTPSHGTGIPVRSLITDLRASDAFSAQGHEGQLIVIVPSKDLVVVRLGRFDDTGDRWDRLGDWMTRVIDCFPSVSG